MAGVRGLLSGPRWDRAAIERFQLRRLQALVRHAFDRVPYYNRLFEQAGFRPDDIQHLDHIARIPPTSRSDLQSLPVGAIVVPGFDPDRGMSHLTSGSSGQPFTVRRTWFEDRLLQAYRLRVLLRLGMRVTDRRAAVVQLQQRGSPLYTKAGLLRYEEIDCVLPPERILARLREIRPDVLRGYPSTLAWLAGRLTGKDRERIRPHLITTDSEMMTPDMRVRIGEAFDAPVVDFYDSHEFNMIASECVVSRGSYHVSDASVIVEVLQDGRSVGPHEEGELVATALHSWTMPFIRLRLGDLVTRGPERCPCGAPSTTLAGIRGRVFERFELPEGRSIHPFALVDPLLDIAPWIRRFQIVQERIDHLRLKLVPMDGRIPTVDQIAELNRALSESLGGGVRVEVELLEEIPASPSGKFRLYYSCVAGSLDVGA